ncbi:hypothetical protein [Pukyongiella litopenaei]|uniref:Uncharacterized protein n=1 Tax=Pukyongiella litopenaei TaxID=2605946 RepID=A0A2S0MNI4_9RHOB|nr:hypothetical protein [Pukyongiella litopenaei]AVO37397.1 hypothetical protein C6Y53_06520 [Pukyongiella litopenaei]
MSVVGRSLYSASAAPNTGLHSAAVIPGLGAGAAFSAYFAVYSTGTNNYRSIWANQDGDCQIFVVSGDLRVRYGNSGSSSGAAVALPLNEWCFVACRFGLNFDGTYDASVEIYRTGDDSTGTASHNTSSVASSIEGDEVHYVLADDPGGSGGVSDDGFQAYLFGFALVDGLWSLDELGCDTSIGEAKVFDAAAEAALIYALRGEDEANPGADNSGNGNHFDVENGGVVLSEIMLPPGASVPSSGGTTYDATASATGAGTATLAATRVRSVSGAATGAASAGLSGTPVKSASATAAGSSAATASATRVRRGSGSAVGGSTASLVATVIKAAAGAAFATSLAAADATAVRNVTGTIGGGSAATMSIGDVPQQASGTAAGASSAALSAIAVRSVTATAIGAAAASADAVAIRRATATVTGSSTASLAPDTEAKLVSATATGGGSAQVSAQRVRRAAAQTAGEGTATASPYRTVALAAHAGGGAAALASPSLIATARATAAGSSSAVLAVGDGIDGRAARVGGITQRTELALSRNRWRLQRR